MPTGCYKFNRSIKVHKFIMRLFKFFAAFIVTAIFVFGLVLGLNWNAFTTFLENRDAMAEGSEWVEKTYSLRGLTEFIAENPGNVSVASTVIGYPDSTILYQADVPRVMGTTSNFFILLAYALEIDRDTFTGDEELLWSDISKYQLPEVDESVHEQSFYEADRRGWINEGAISLKNSLKLLAEYNDLALADFLWWQLNRDIWPELKNILGLETADMPLPFSGLYLAISPGLQKMSSDSLIDYWQSSPDEDWRAFVTEQSNLYLTDSSFRKETSDFLERNRLGTTFIEERNAMILFPKITTHEMISLMQKLWTNEVISETASKTVKDWMRWPIEQQSEIKRDFTDYGAIYDNRMGLLNGLDFGTSAYTGDTTVQAVFFDRLPIAFWFHMSSNHMHQDFQQRLIFDPALIDHMKRVAQNNSERSITSDPN